MTDVVSGPHRQVLLTHSCVTQFRRPCSVTHAALQHLINCHFIVLIIYLLDTNLYPFSKISVPVHLKAVIKSAPGDTPILADVAVLTQQFNQLISWIVDEV